MTKNLAAVVVLVACALLAGCSSVWVSTDYDRGVDFTTLRTFAWMPRSSGETGPYDDDSLVRGRIVSAVERELTARGLSRADASPDFSIALQSSTRERVSVTTWPGWGYGWGCGWGHGWGWGGDRIDVTQYTEGVLVVDFVDLASKRLLWRGIARSVVNESSGSPEAVDASIHAMLEKFPPATR